MKAMRHPLGWLACSVLAGCAATSLQFDYQPKSVDLASDPGAGHALVLGQAYMRGPGDWVYIIVTAIDGSRTNSAMQLRQNINFLVPPGQRTLRAKVQIGNFLQWQESDALRITAGLEPGIVYQLSAREGTDIRGREGVQVWIERVGTREQYDAYLARHPDFKRGQPLDASQLRE